jgi:two-component system phosphate regulon sensor histidine kinase PhoR
MQFATVMMPRLRSFFMNDPLGRALAATGGLLAVALVIEIFVRASLWLFALCSAVLLTGLYLFRQNSGRRHILRLPDNRDGVPSLPGKGSEQSCGVGVLDNEYRLVWCNEMSRRHFGFGVERHPGQAVGQLVRERSFARYLAAGDFSRPLRLKTARGSGMVLSVWLVPYVGSQWLLMSLDVTQTARLDAMRQDCVANALHEMCTPVTVLAWHLDNVKDLKQDPRQAQDALVSMEEQCRRMRRLLDELLQISTLDALPEPPCDERVDVGEVLARIHAETEALSAGRHRIVVEAETGCDLLGARTEITSAFSNLASNAVRYTQPGGEIRLIWRGSRAGAEFTVKDTGIGIAREHLPRLTERFFRVDREQMRKTAGSGLGLAIVKGVLDRHQATLEIESEQGRGSRFTAKFPAHRVVAAPAREPARKLSASAAGLLPDSLEQDRLRRAQPARAA